MVVLGIDPGFHFTGYGILKTENSKSFLIDFGYLKLSSNKKLQTRVKIFYDFFSEKIQKWNISDISLETPFLGKNIQSFLKLGYLRGILYLLSEQNNITIHEFSPREVKQSVTGFGGASKDQVARVILSLFPKLPPPKKNDVTDALAITLCGYWTAKQSFKTFNI